MNKREKNLQECLISSTAGMVIAMILCLTLPEIVTKSEMAALFALFWFILTYCVWSVIDWAQKCREAWERATRQQKETTRHASCKCIVAQKGEE